MRHDASWRAINHAADDLDDWSTYLPPTPGYVEQVYFSSPTAAADGWATTLLASENRSRGFAVHYKTDTLPYFSQWKNTVGSADGYVTGLEPVTAFRTLGRLKKSKVDWFLWRQVSRSSSTCD